MIALFLLFFPSFIEPSEIFNKKAPGYVPEIQRINDTYLSLDYQADVDFSTIKNVRLYQKTPITKLLAEASEKYEGEPTIQTDGVLGQPLEEGQNILAIIDP